MSRFRFPKPNQLLGVSLRDVHRRIRDDIVLLGSGSLYFASEAIRSGIDRFLTGLGRPRFSFSPILPGDPLDPRSFSEMTKDIANDLSAQDQEIAALYLLGSAVHNHSQVIAGELARRAEGVAGLVDDLMIISDQAPGEILVFSDRFIDSSKIDSSFPTEYPIAEVMPGQGALTLARSGAVTVAPEEVEIFVTPISPPGLDRLPKFENIGRFYEGHFHAYLGYAEPEGGSFHFEERVDSASVSQYTQASFQVPDPTGALQPDGTRKLTPKDLREFVVPGGQEAHFLELIKSGMFSDLSEDRLRKFVNVLRRKTHRADRAMRRSYLYLLAHPDEGVVPSSEVQLGPENVLVMDAGANEEELQESRRKMIDGDPSSYWQCEVAYRSTKVQEQVDALISEQLVTMRDSGLLADKPQPAISADEIRRIVQGGDVDLVDLEVEVVLRLSSPRVLNWVTITPMVFDDGAILEVTDLSTAPDLESGYVPVESFLDRTRPNLLGEDVNQEIREDDAAYVLAPGRGSYRGTGVWPFSPRQVRQVRVRLKQRTPVSSPYETMVLQANRTTTLIRARK